MGANRPFPDIAARAALAEVKEHEGQKNLTGKTDKNREKCAWGTAEKFRLCAPDAPGLEKGGAAAVAMGWGVLAKGVGSEAQGRRSAYRR
jgi:hypothetical protein